MEPILRVTSAHLWGRQPLGIQASADFQLKDKELERGSSPAANVSGISMALHGGCDHNVNRPTTGVAKGTQPSLSSISQVDMAVVWL